VRAAVLVTGMSGTGKTTALRALAARGHRVVETDDDGWWCDVVDDPGDPSSEARLWREDRVAALLDDHRDGWLFVSGTVENQGRLYDRFDAVVLLTCDTEVLLRRIAERTDNPWGKAPHERAAVLHHVETVEPLLRRGATHVVDTDRPPEDVVAMLEDVARRRRR
jgi:dephospho-CoA kinase